VDAREENWRNYLFCRAWPNVVSTMPIVPTLAPILQRRDDERQFEHDLRKTVDCDPQCGVDTKRHGKASQREIEPEASASPDAKRK
jgi:hypothetical protein